MHIEAEHVATEVLLDYLILSEISRGAYTKQAVIEKLGPPAGKHLEELIAHNYLVVRGETLEVTKKGYERCTAYDKLADNLFPISN
jgi:hypothetical protein